VSAHLFSSKDSIGGLKLRSNREKKNSKSALLEKRHLRKTESIIIIFLPIKYILMAQIIP